MRKRWGAADLAVLAAFVLVFVAVNVIPALAASDSGGFFNQMYNTFLDFVFHKIGKILFVVFLFAGLLALSKSVALALTLIGIAIFLAVGSGLASAIWDFFSSAFSGSTGLLHVVPMHIHAITQFHHVILT